MPLSYARFPTLGDKVGECDNQNHATGASAACHTSYILILCLMAYPLQGHSRQNRKGMPIRTDMFNTRPDGRRCYLVVAWHLAYHVFHMPDANVAGKPCMASHSWQAMHGELQEARLNATEN